MKHDQDLCVECAYVGTCNGQPADDCDLMNLVEFEAALNDRLAKLDDQFSTINDVLNEKKEAFKEMYRRNPKLSHDEAISFLQATNEAFDLTNPDGSLQQNTMQEQLTDLQDQLVQLQEQLARQHEISAEAEEMRAQLVDQKNQLDNKCHGLEQRLNEEKLKSQTLFEAIINLQAREKGLEGQLVEKEVARQNLEAEKISLEKKWDRRQEDLVQTNDKLVKTQREKTNLEQGFEELQSSLSRAERRNEELQSALDNETREKFNLVQELKKVNSNLQDDIAAEYSEVEDSEVEDFEAEDFEADVEIRRLKRHLKEIQKRLQRRNEVLKSALDNETRVKSNLVEEVKKLNSKLEDEIEKLTRDLNEDSEAEDSDAGDSDAEDSETDGEIRRLEGNLKEIQKRLQRRNEEVLSALDNKAREKSFLIGELKKVNSNLRILTRKDSGSEDSGSEDSESEYFDAEDSIVEDSEADGELRRLKGNLKDVMSALDKKERVKSFLIGELKKVNSNLRILTRNDSESEYSESEDSEAEDFETDGEMRRLEGHLEEIQKRVRDAIRVKSEQTMRIKSLNATEQIIICDSFSDDNVGVTVSSCKRSVKKCGYIGYCFLNHPKIEKNQILKWSLRVPKFLFGYIGMVIILE